MARKTVQQIGSHFSPKLRLTTLNCEHPARDSYHRNATAACQRHYSLRTVTTKMNNAINITPGMKRRHAKVRTGCVTCKTRRIKCDEQKPECSRCRIGGRKCIYAVPRTWIFEPENECSAPSPALTDSLADDAERRAIVFYREQTAPAFSGGDHLTKQFWTNFVLQVANSEPTVWHLAVALAAKHESLPLSKHESPAAGQLARKHYSTALSTLSKNLPQMRPDIVLLCSQVLLAYSNIDEDATSNSAALEHMIMGVAILRQENTGDNVVDCLRKFIEPMFAALELITAMYSVPLSGVPLRCSVDEPQPILPTHFSDILQAKTYLVRLLRWRFYSELHPGQKNELHLLKPKGSLTNPFSIWRHLFFEYSERVRLQDAAAHAKAQQVMFEYKLLEALNTAFTNPKYCSITRVRVVEVDLSIATRLLVACSIERDPLYSNSSPLAIEQDIHSDNVTIWPSAKTVGIQGTRQIVHVCLSM